MTRFADDAALLAAKDATIEATTKLQRVINKEVFNRTCKCCMKFSEIKILQKFNYLIEGILQNVTSIDTNLFPEKCVGF